VTVGVLVASAQNARALWYLARASGLVAMVLLTVTVVLGIVSTVGWASARWPRFASQALHRNLSLLCLALIAIHVATIVADGYVPIGVLDAVVPFRTPYRRFWVGLGAGAFDLLVAVLVTSALRRHIGHRAWRAVHWLAYACWPITLAHGLGSGTDTRLGPVQLLYVVCAGMVAVAVAWRLVAAGTAAKRTPRPSALPGRHSRTGVRTP